jgi:RNA-binding protein PNO1
MADEEHNGPYEHGEDLMTEYTDGTVSLAQQEAGDEDEVEEGAQFAALTAMQMNQGHANNMRVYVPPQRLTPLRENWMDIYTPIVQHMKLQIRFDPVKKYIELQTCEETESPQAITKAADFCRAFVLGFELRDAIAMLRLDDLYIDSFHMREVKILSGEELSRAVGRVAGHNGKTKFTIENATKTRVVLADGSVHILGSYKNIRYAKDAIVALVIGSPPGKIYTKMRNVAARTKMRF